MLGLTSITFRKLSCAEIVDLVRRGGLEGIEWGGDIHVPPGDADAALGARRLTEEAGLRVLSYGSYYRLCAGGAFDPVLESAHALGAPMIRVWAGEKGSADADEAYYESAAKDLREICEKAARYQMRIGLEYHRNTLTDNLASAEKLLNLVPKENLTTYWQPNPDIPLEERLMEITSLLPKISTIHVFNWTVGNVRHPLGEAADVWKRYIAALGLGERDYLIEFVKGDSLAAFLSDARALRDFFAL